MSRIVVKPSRGEQGRGVHVDVRTEDEMRAAVAAAGEHDTQVLLEEMVEGEDLLTLYQFNTGTAKHYFCSTCGIKSFAAGTSKDGSATRAINARCIDDVDLDALVVQKFDGKSY